ncbi:MAG: TonB-dependent receptor [Flavipsychrobacter sp.]
MYRKVLMLLLCLVPFVEVAMAQSKCDIEIRVTVLEAHNKQPIYPAVVFVDELNKAFDTDEKGKLVINNVCAGKYTFHFHAQGYEHALEQVVVQESVELKFKVAHLNTELSEVVVAEERQQSLLQSKEQLNKAELDANSGKTLGDMLQAVNGVTTISNGATIAKPVIHGLHSNRIVLMNNGVRQEDQQWGGEHAPNIDPFLANNITVVKGAASVQYGTDAIAGVVLVEPAPLRSQPGWEGELNLAGFSNNRMGVASAMVGHNFKKIQPLSFRLQGTFKQGGNYRIPNYWVANTGVKENNYSAALGWRKLHYGAEVFYSRFNTDLGIYRGAHTGNQDDLNAAIRSDKPLVVADFTYDIERPRQHVEHDLIKAKGYLDTKYGMLHATYAYQHNFRQEYDVLRQENGKAQLNVTLNTQTLNLNMEHRPVWKLKGKIGVDGIVQENFIQPGDRVFIPNYRSNGWAAYLIERYKGNNLLLEAGLRYDYRSYDVYNAQGTNQQVAQYHYNFNNVSGTIGLTKQVSKNWEVITTVANSWRAPQTNELFSAGFHHGAARIELGNTNLSPERSYNLNVESKHRFGTKLSTEIALYTQYIQNFIYLEPGNDLLTIRGYFKTFNYKQTNAHLTGADLGINYLWSSSLTSKIKASFLLARNVTAKDWLILMPADRLSLSTTYKKDINEKIREAFVSIDGRYVFQQKRIPANFDQIDFPRPPKGYFLLDASVGAKLLVNQQPIHLSLSVTNILNQRYRDYLDAFRYFIDQQGRNVILRVRVPISINQ